MKIVSDVLNCVFSLGCWQFFRSTWSCQGQKKKKSQSLWGNVVGVHFFKAPDGQVNVREWLKAEMKEERFWRETCVIRFYKLVIYSEILLLKPTIINISDCFGSGVDCCHENHLVKLNEQWKITLTSVQWSVNNLIFSTAENLNFNSHIDKFVTSSCSLDSHVMGD